MRQYIVGMKLEETFSEAQRAEDSLCGGENYISESGKRVFRAEVQGEGLRGSGAGDWESCGDRKSTRLNSSH